MGEGRLPHTFGSQNGTRGEGSVCSLFLSCCSNGLCLLNTTVTLTAQSAPSVRSLLSSSRLLNEARSLSVSVGKQKRAVTRDDETACLLSQDQQATALGGTFCSSRPSVPSCAELEAESWPLGPGVYSIWETLFKKNNAKPWLQNWIFT